MLLQCFIGRLAQLNRIVGRNGAGWEITAGFASKAARKRSRQVRVASAVHGPRESKFMCCRHSDFTAADFTSVTTLQ